MGSTKSLNLKKPDEKMFGTFKGKPKELLKEFKKSQSEKGELEGLRSVRKKYGIKPKYTYPLEKLLLEKEKKQETKKNDYTLGKKSLLGK